MKITREHMLLYAVTDRSGLGGTPLEDAVEELLAAGVTCVQLREKNASKADFAALARALLPICARRGAPLLINDDVALARAVGADGVHVGRGDMEIARARALLGPEKIIGASAHSVAEARQAEAQGADYLGCGAVFCTGTKRDATVLAHEELRRICAAVSLPVVAIGGIGPDNARALCGTGVDGIAVVSALFSAPDRSAAARELLALAREVAASAH